MQSDTACFQAALEAKRAELLFHAHKLEEICIDQAVDQGDHLQRQVNRGLVIHQIDFESSVFRQVKAALARIRSGDFGICVGCDKSIPARRLHIAPWAAYCVSCQEQAGWFVKDHVSDGHLNVVED